MPAMKLCANQQVTHLADAGEGADPEDARCIKE